MLKLIINFNTGKEHVIEITDFPCTIGRWKENEIHIDDESLSDFHVRIKKEGNDFIIRDLNEESNTFFKNQHIKERKIKHNDVLQLGEVNVLFQIKIDETAVLMKKYFPGGIIKQEGSYQNRVVSFEPAKDFCSRDISIQSIEKRAVAGGAGILPFLSFISSIFRHLLFGMGAFLKAIKRYKYPVISLSIHLILAVIFCSILVVRPSHTPETRFKVAIKTKPEIHSKKIENQPRPIKPKKVIKPPPLITKIVPQIKPLVKISLKTPSLKPLPLLHHASLSPQPPGPRKIATKHKGYWKTIVGKSTHGQGLGNGFGHGRGNVSFFGMGGGKGGGNIEGVVYVVDRSGSMDGEKIDLVKRELRRSISNLRPSQRFTVIFYCSPYEEIEFGIGKLYGSRYKTLEDMTRIVVAPKQIGIGSLKEASSGNKKESYGFINSIGAGGSTWPYEAIKRALRYEPNLIYFLTDGVFAQHVNTRIGSFSIYDDIASLNNGKHTIINTIGFQSPRESKTMLKKIAKQNNGEYRYVQ